MNFNFINLTISPLLIGIGIDNGLHLLHRWREEDTEDGKKESIEVVFSRTGLAIATTSLTTIAVFGSLLIARTPGLRVLGFTALMGVGFTMLFSLTALPAILALAFPDRDQYNSPRDDC
ncbi:MAG: MMPL family transporter [Candidatus Acetothermia bacterium]